MNDSGINLVDDNLMIPKFEYLTNKIERMLY